jgi:hypothetical protein
MYSRLPLELGVYVITLDFEDDVFITAIVTR